MDKLVALSNKTEGRDKFCKILQYGCRLLKALTSDKKLQERLNGLFVATRDARKAFRLGKFLNELLAISKVLSDISIDLPEMILQILSKSSMFIYFVYDNLAFLSSIKFLKFNAATLSKKSNV